MPSVRELMTGDPVVIDGGAPVIEAARLMSEHDIGAVGVEREGRLAGVLTDRDIVVRAVARDRDPRRLAVAELCSEELVTVIDDADLAEAEARMRERRVRRLFVVDDDGRPLGVLSADDITAHREPDSVIAAQIGESGLLRGDQGWTGQAE
jgi:CBS domain-containing protein